MVLKDHHVQALLSIFGNKKKKGKVAVEGNLKAVLEEGWVHLG